MLSIPADSEQAVALVSAIQRGDVEGCRRSSRQHPELAAARVVDGAACRGRCCTLRRTGPVISPMALRRSLSLRRPGRTSTPPSSLRSLPKPRCTGRQAVTMSRCWTPCSTPAATLRHAARCSPAGRRCQTRLSSVNGVPLAGSSSVGRQRPSGRRRRSARRPGSRVLLHRAAAVAGADHRRAMACVPRRTAGHCGIPASTKGRT